jgi:hypothetical protein
VARYSVRRLRKAVKEEAVRARRLSLSTRARERGLNGGGGGKGGGGTGGGCCSGRAKPNGSDMPLMRVVSLGMKRSA